MKLVPYNGKDLNVNGYKKTKNLCVLEEFRDSDLDCAEVKEYTHCSADCCAASLNNSIKVFRLNRLRAIVRKGKVYLIKEPI